MIEPSRGSKKSASLSHSVRDLGLLTDTVLIICIQLPDTMEMDARAVVRSCERVRNMNNDSIAPICDDGWARD